MTTTTKCTSRKFFQFYTAGRFTTSTILDAGDPMPLRRLCAELVAICQTDAASFYPIIYKIQFRLFCSERVDNSTKRKQRTTLPRHKMTLRLPQMKFFISFLQCSRAVGLPHILECSTKLHLKIQCIIIDCIKLDLS